jgi:hypothetical protein
LKTAFYTSSYAQQVASWRLKGTEVLLKSLATREQRYIWRPSRCLHQRQLCALKESEDSCFPSLWINTNPPWFHFPL